MCEVKGYVRGSTPAARPCHRRHHGRRRLAQGYLEIATEAFPDISCQDTKNFGTHCIEG